MFSLLFPESGREGYTEISTPGPVVLIGANGSGKTRLSVWIEETLNNLDKPVLRISAQKSLDLPDQISLSTPEIAERRWIYGRQYSQSVAGQLNDRNYLRIARLRGRWGTKPVTGSLDDFPALLEMLLADHATEILTHNERIEAAQAFLPIPETRLRRVRRIWEEILPDRRLLINTGSIQTQPAHGSPYNSAEMSDGERVVLYLLGSCMSAAPGAVLLIDEPELHIHRLIQRRLWDLVEKERDDCLFVYLTHDLDFAASRSVATQIALQGYDGQQWTWTAVPRETDLPEDVLLSILGSRKPVLFTEGDESSLDVQVYSYVYPNHTVIPVGSCSNVIHSTTSFERQKHLHHIACEGLIDRDQRTDAEIASLEKVGVYATGVSEAENLLLLEPVVRLVADILHRDQVDEIFEKIRVYVLDHVKRDRDRIVAAMLNGHLEERLTTMRGGGRTEDELSTELSKLSQNIRTVADRFRARVDEVVEQGDYHAALAIYPNKGLGARISKFLGLNDYREDTVRLVKKEAGASIVEALRKALPAV
jgi:energy-coupling factor transporter ATP-binding protein EcfA2